MHLRFLVPTQVEKKGRPQKKRHLQFLLQILHLFRCCRPFLASTLKRPVQ